MGTYDVICIGDAKIDTFIKITDSEGRFYYDPTSNELRFKHGEKIPVEATYIAMGGNAANVSVGLSRLEIKATIAAEIGDDEFSLKIVNALARENIDRGFLKSTKGAFTSFSVAIAYKDNRTLFSEHVDRKHDFFYETATTKWIYLTSLGEDWVTPYQKALTFAKTKNVKIAFNPGTIQLLQRSAIIDSVFRDTELLFINKEEAKRLVKNYDSNFNSDVIQEILANVKKMGPKNVVITDGANGSYSMDENNNLFHQDRIDCTIVELTGAGDAYATGFLAGFIHGKSMQDSMLWGSHNAASVVGMVGAQEGLLRKQALEEKIHGSK
jgi:sugar/nucleoside kinase (ribokinase family)